MNRRNFLSSTASGLLAASIVPKRSSDDDQAQDLPKPSTQQVAWQDCELGMFFHFNIPVFKPGWDWRSWKDLPDPKLYDPAEAQNRPVAPGGKLPGSKVRRPGRQALQRVPPVAVRPLPLRSVKQSPWRGGKGDLVRDFVKSCERFNIKPGIYASVTANGYLEVDNPGLVNRGRGGDPAKQAAYSRICGGMLSELWGRYGGWCPKDIEKACFTGFS